MLRPRLNKSKERILPYGILCFNYVAFRNSTKDWLPLNELEIERLMGLGIAVLENIRKSSRCSRLSCLTVVRGGTSTPADSKDSINSARFNFLFDIPRLKVVDIRKIQNHFHLIVFILLSACRSQKVKNTNIVVRVSPMPSSCLFIGIIG